MFSMRGKAESNGITGNSRDDANDGREPTALVNGCASMLALARPAIIVSFAAWR